MHVSQITHSPLNTRSREDHTGTDLSPWIATVEGRLAQVTMELQQVRQEMNSEHRHFSSSFKIPQLLHEQFCHNFLLSCIFHIHVYYSQYANTSNHDWPELLALLFTASSPFLVITIFGQIMMFNWIHLKGGLYRNLVGPYSTTIVL